MWLSALCVGCPLPKVLVLISVKRLNRSQDHSAPGIFKSSAKSNYLFETRTRDLQAYSIVAQSTTLLRAPPTFCT
jgi:hypothetical protein